MVSRTREKLIEVARQLFAYKGVENTTMSDIANASDKGRRTIYTYFKSKREIYEATVESDNDRMSKQLDEIVSIEVSAIEKLKNLLEYWLDMYEKSVQRPRSLSLNSLLPINLSRNDKSHSPGTDKKKAVLIQILEQGIRERSLDPEQARRAVMVIQLVMNGVELALSQGTYDDVVLSDKKEYKEVIINYIIKSLIP